ncbi:hypothetical protein Esti_005425 [Eimeria stiedai]
MATRTPVWGREHAASHSPLRCLLCLGFDLTLWDLARILPCLVWSCMALACACVFLQYPIVHNRPAHLLPMLGAIQSAMPAFMCGALLLMYHRQRVQAVGIPRETAAALGGFYCIASTLGCFAYLTFLLTTVFVLQARALTMIPLLLSLVQAADADVHAATLPVDRTEEPAYFFLSSTWLLVTLLWFILQSCLKPSTKQLEALVQVHENSQLPYAITAAFPAAPAGVVVGAPVAVGGAPVGGPLPERGGPLGQGSQRLGGAPSTQGGAETEMIGTATEAGPVVVGQVRS